MKTVTRQLIAALAVTAVVSGSGLAAASGPPKEERFPGPVRCLDITHGEGRLSLLDAALPTSVGGNVVSFTIDVAEPSCTDGTYRFDVFDDDAALTPVGSSEIAGDGTTTLSTTIDILPDANGCVYVQVTTADADGDVVDVAPDDGLGGPVGDVSSCGGGGSYWK